MDWQMLIAPLSGAIIGYSTNWLAIKMLFRPLTEKRIGRFKIPFTPGLIPKERQALAKKVSETIDKHLLTKESLVATLHSPTTLHAIHQALVQLFETLEQDESNIGSKLSEDVLPRFQEHTETIETFMVDALQNHLPKSLAFFKYQLETNPIMEGKLKTFVIQIIEENVGGLVGMFIKPEKIYESIREKLIAYMADETHHEVIADQICEFSSDILNNPAAWETLSQKLHSTTISDLTKLIKDKEAIISWIEGQIKILLEKYAENLISVFDLKTIIEDKINEMDAREVEQILLSVVRNELQMITFLGGLLGLLIGGLTLFLP